MDMEVNTWMQLRPGMLTTEGLIVKVNPPGTSKLFGLTPSILYYNLNDCYYGPVTRAVRDGEQFFIAHAKGSDEYDEMLIALSNQQREVREDADTNLKWLYDMMNPPIAAPPNVHSLSEHATWCEKQNPPKDMVRVGDMVMYTDSNDANIIHNSLVITIAGATIIVQRTGSDNTYCYVIDRSQIVE